MEWVAAFLLVVARTVHFAATTITVGTIIFDVVVARPALGAYQAIALSHAARKMCATLIGLAVVVISGVIWLLLEAAAMSGTPFGDALSWDVLSTVVAETQFGQVGVFRMCLAICLGATLMFDRMSLARWLGAASALALAGCLAWTGHAGSTIGPAGTLHLASDGLHLIAASAWIGGLPALLTLLREASHCRAVSLVRAVVERFSILGIASVATLVTTGLINSAILVGSPRGLFTTEYGWVLLLKIGLFAAMLIVAAVNRFRLTPELRTDDKRGPAALRLLTRNCAIEIALGLMIIALVGLLGTLHPAIHLL